MNRPCAPDSGSPFPSGLDWSAMLRTALQGLGLRPEEFWRLTPAEFLLLLGQGDGEEGVAPMGRRRLDELLRAFPDHRQQSPE